MKGMCPYCEKQTELRKERKPESYSIRNRTITVESEYFVCAECHRDFSTSEQMENALRQGYDKFRETEDIISPQEIIAIRQQYGASQKAFAKILDLGELTINSYEQGALPAKSVSNFLRLMGTKDNFKKLFLKNKGKLSKMQLRKISAALGLDEMKNDSHTYYQCIDPDTFHYAKEPYTGYGEADWEKLLSMMQLILFYAQKGLYKTALLKICFYADFASYKRNSVPISCWPYARVPFGPVPQDFKELLIVGEEEGKFQSGPDENEIGDIYQLADGQSEQELLSGFSQTQVQIIREVAEALKDKSCKEISELTHKEKAWLETSNAQLIDYGFAKDLLLF
jgi:putative zinc finger/helix-turn-helix YgiT family protein